MIWQDLAEDVRETLPSFSFRPMVQMLSKFLGFMNLTVCYVCLARLHFVISLLSDAVSCACSTVCHLRSVRCHMPRYEDTYHTYSFLEKYIHILTYYVFAYLNNNRVRMFALLAVYN